MCPVPFGTVSCSRARRGGPRTRGGPVGSPDNRPNRTRTPHGPGATTSLGPFRTHIPSGLRVPTGGTQTRDTPTESRRPKQKETHFSSYNPVSALMAAENTVISADTTSPAVAYTPIQPPTPARPAKRKPDSSAHVPERDVSPSSAAPSSRSLILERSGMG